MGLELYGITGKRGHGKDTLAKAVVEKNSEFKILHFADELKRQCGEIFGLTKEQMHDPVIKEERLSHTVFMDDFLDKMCELTGLIIRPKSLYANTPRAVMQLYGTDYVRSAKDSYWIDCVVKQLKDGGKYLIPDTRYANEVDAITECGGIIVKIVRTDKTSTDEASNHSSETSIDDIKAAVNVMTTTGDFGPINEVAELISSGKMIERIQVGFASQELNKLIDGFNVSFRQWELVHGMGANIVPNYNHTTGKKEWIVSDVGVKYIEAPDNRAIAVASNVLQRAMESMNGKNGEVKKASS